MIPPSAESRNLYLFLRGLDNGIHSPFSGKDETNTRVDSGLQPIAVSYTAYILY
ncbi:MAG: hypothetical protein LBP64_01410 [Tannerella sp.]|nr:hypothetical protein [Tannerella sp.]